VSGRDAAAAPTDRSNLALRAAELLRRTCPGAGAAPAAEIAIDKSIPVAGGLAGGSADAAAALVALNQLWSLGLGFDRLLELAAQLGSDVPFALVGGHAIGQGRGEALSPLDGCGLFEWVLLTDSAGLSTPAVFRRFDQSVGAGRGPEPPPIPAGLLAGLRAGDPWMVGANLVNDLEPAAFELRPELARRARRAIDAGACGAVISGSGPTVACLAADGPAANALAARLAAADPASVALRATGPAPGAGLAGAGESC
jgi:4-diphosphocytidyl-2-C-methyl-D-erythritol kinase